MPKPTKTALITGGSGGIGLELAKLFVSDGYQVVLVGRSRKHLADAAKALGKRQKVLTIASDLSHPGAAADVYRTLQRKKITVDALVNNAGYGLHGPFLATSPADEQAMIRVNVATLTDFCKLLAPAMAARGAGRILNVASVAGFYPGPLMAVYYATKAFVVSFSQALNVELAANGVSVTCLCPGPTKTNFFKRADYGDARMLGRSAMTSAEVARIGYRGLIRGKRLVVPGFRNKLAVLGTRFVGRRAAARFAMISNSNR